MIIARSFQVQSSDLEALARRVGRQLSVRVGAPVVLLTGLDAETAFSLGGAGDAAVLAELVSARLPPEIARLLQPQPPPALELGGRRWAFDEGPFMLGIVNVTPDSFSDGGRHATTDTAIAHALQLVEEGAHLLDVGGESTRPGAAAVSPDEECARVLPVIEALTRLAPQTPISIDTSKAEVARRALAAGATLVNDVTALSDPLMGRVVAEAKAAVCLMHMQGTPRTMQVKPEYGDVVHEVAESLSEAIDRAVAVGIDRSRVLIDPGIGFGKTLEHNLLLLRHLGAFRALGAPILLGTSRKSFLGALTGEKDASKRLVPSVTSVAIAAAQGAADVVRVHDVAATKEALLVAKAIRLGAR
ncbi:MAG: dihydropteroate synthase [Archangiaceae bacterium]|nr:dihydropteroate synthase [Archangiaceae bacterium]